jgi:hypothetical protein
MAVSSARVYVGGGVFIGPISNPDTGAPGHNIGLVALRRSTGAPDPSFQPRLRIPPSDDSSTIDGLALAGRRLYVSGGFTAVRRSRIAGLAAVDPGAGALAGRFRPPALDAPVIVPAGRLVYASTTPDGDGVTRVSVASGRLDRAFAAHTDGPVCGLAVIGSRLFAGGDFTAVDGSRQPRFATFALGRAG